MIKISAVIITFNEGRNIGRCLTSIQTIADEIIVLDSFSTDNTEEICRCYGVRFFQQKFEGYLEQKNAANALASHDFILSLDADEVLSPELQESMSNLLKNERILSAYAVHRLTQYAGKWIHHSGWYPDKKVRLFDKKIAYWGHENPHERLILLEETVIGLLTGDLLHYSYYTVEEHRVRSKRYALMAAKTAFNKGKKPYLGQAYFSATAAFIKMFFLKKGFLDGHAGWHIARISASEKWLKYRTASQLFERQGRG